MKTILLPSGQKCRPRRLRAIYGILPVFLTHCQLYNIARRISKESPAALWKRNPFIVSSVVPSDMAEYDARKHPTLRSTRCARMAFRVGFAAMTTAAKAQTVTPFVSLAAPESAAPTDTAPPIPIAP